VRQRGRGLERRQRPRRAELQLHDVVEVVAHHVDPLEHLAERDGEEATGGRAGAAAAERPRRNLKVRRRRDVEGDEGGDGDSGDGR